MYWVQAGVVSLLFQRGPDVSFMQKLLSQQVHIYGSRLTLAGPTDWIRVSLQLHVVFFSLLVVLRNG